MKKLFFLLTGAVLLISGCRTEKTLVDETSFRNVSRYPERKLLNGIRVLTLEKAREIALRNNPGYKASFRAVDAARMRYYQAIGAYAPVISAGLGVGQQLAQNSGSENYPGGDNVFYTNTSIFASWTLFDGLIREFNYLGAKRGLKAQELEEENAKRLLLRAVAYAYHDIQKAKAQIDLAKADLEFQNRMYREARLKRKAGTVPASEPLNFRGRANLARENRIEAEYRYELGLYSLSVLLGYPEGTIPAGISFEPIKELLAGEARPLEVLLDNALANRPDLRAYRERLRIARYRVYKAYGAFLPVISAFANYSYSTDTAQLTGNNTGGFGSFALSGNAFNYGISAGWLLFNGGIRYNLLREAKISHEIAVLLGEGIWLNVVHEVRSAYSNYTHCRKVAELARDNVSVMQQQRDLTEKEYIAGEIEVTRLNEAQLNLIRSLNAWSDSLVQYHKAAEQLRTAAGEQAPEKNR